RAAASAEGEKQPADRTEGTANADEMPAERRPTLRPPRPAGGAPMEFRLPALGEGIDAATVVGVLVKPGDAVQAGQNVIAVETDKAAVEVPVEAAGTVAEVHVKPGDKVPVGGLILTLQASGAAKPDGQKQPAPRK